MRNCTITVTDTTTTPQAKTRRTVKESGPHPVDITIGHRIRTLRKLRGLTQDQMAKLIGITFQQVQKYERGFNRVSGSRLVMLGEALNVPASYFLSGVNLDGTEVQEDQDAKGAKQKDLLPELSSREMDLLHHICRLPEPSRSALESLVRSVSHPKITLNTDSQPPNTQAAE